MTETTLNGSAPAEASTPPEVVELLAERDRLRTSYQAAQERAYNARRQHEEDIEKIGAALIEEASSRSWCGEYDTFVDGLNGDLHIPLPGREKEYGVTVSGYLRVPFSYTITVTSADDDKAEEEAREKFEGEVTADTLRSCTEDYNAEVDYDDLEFEVEEA